MNKEQFMRSYVVLSLFVGLYYLIATYLYQAQFTVEMYVLIERSIFQVTLVEYLEDTIITNMPLIAFGIIFLLNLVVILVGTKDLDTDKKGLQEVAYFNLLFTFLLIVGQMAFVFMIPDRINGTPRDLLVFTEFPLTNDSLVRAINLNYLISFVYVVYNLLVLVQTSEPKERSELSVEEEEGILAELLK